MGIGDFITGELICIIRKRSFDKQKEVISFLKKFNSLFNKNALEYILKELESLEYDLKFFFEVINLIIAIEDDYFDRNLLNKSEELLEKSPENKLVQLLWIKNKILQFRHGEYLDSEYAVFLKRIYENYCDLAAEIDDFARVMGLILKPKWEIWDKDIFQDALEAVVFKCTKGYRYEFKLILAKIYFYDQRYEDSLKILEKLRESEKIKEFLKKEKRKIPLPDSEYFSYADYVDTVQTIAIIKNIKGDIKGAFKDASWVLNNLPDFKVPHKDMLQKIFYMDSYFIRMRYNLLKNIEVEVKKDYEKIKDFIDISDWQEHYFEVTDHIKKKFKN